MIKYIVSHNGCEPTSYESEVLRISINKIGYKEVLSPEFADIIFFLCCTFTAQKEIETKKLISYYKNFDKIVIVTGCILEKENFDGDVKYIKLKNILPYLSKNKLISENNFPKLSMIQISEGCAGRCSFCSIKNVRGKHRSVSKSIILQQIKYLHEQNISCVSLVGQDVAAYGTEIKSSLTDLLSEIFSHYPDINIKLGSLNPNHLLRMREDDLKVLTSERIEGQLHIPIQSANNSILRLMMREYSVEEYESLYCTLVALGAKNISTDIISGFPYETNLEHQNNVTFLEKHYFSFAEIFMFEPRPNTLAYNMDILPIESRTERTIELIARFLSTYAKHNNIELSILSEERQPYNTNIIFN